MRTLLRAGLSLFALTMLFISLPILFPEPLFAYKVEYENLTVYSDRPIPQTEAVQVLAEVQERLVASPVQVGDIPMQLFVANTHWRRGWLWIMAPSTAGGFVVVPGSGRGAFLSGADFAANELIAPSGFRPEPPRTLAYYGAHELTHVVVAELVGPLRFYLMPNWVREGLPDYAAFPPETAVSLYAQIGERERDSAMIRDHGVYAHYRLLVAYFLDAGWSVEDLLDTDMAFEEAQAMAFEGLRER